jgi:hypothetical protein
VHGTHPTLAGELDRLIMAVKPIFYTSFIRNV